MALNAQSYIRAAYPPPLRKPVEQPRTFVLHWNNAKQRNPKQRDPAWHEAHGVRFPNGRVALDFGPPYESMTELQDALTGKGEFRFEWDDEQEQ